jgi:hypothetical protein
LQSTAFIVAKNKEANSEREQRSKRELSYPFLWP